MNYWSQKQLQQFDCSYLIFLSKVQTLQLQAEILKVLIL